MENEIITTVFNDGVLTVKLPGEIDHHLAKSVRAETDKKLVTVRPKKLILDMTQTSFMDSSGLGLILGRARTCEQLNIEYTIVNPSPRVRTILNLAGVDRILDIRGV